MFGEEDFEEAYPMRRKGKSKGKGQSLFESALWQKLTATSYLGQNPKDRSGKTMECHACGSTDQLVAKCPKSRKGGGKGKSFYGFPAQTSWFARDSDMPAGSQPETSDPFELHTESEFTEDYSAVRDSEEQMRYDNPYSADFAHTPVFSLSSSSRQSSAGKIRHRVMPLCQIKSLAAQAVREL